MTEGRNGVECARSAIYASNSVVIRLRDQIFTVVCEKVRSARVNYLRSLLNAYISCAKHVVFTVRLIEVLVACTSAQHGSETHLYQAKDGLFGRTGQDLVHA